MKKSILFIFYIFIVHLSFAQTAGDALTPGSQNLKERFSIMKTKSQSYQDYKVIKETILDGMWRIILDSIKTKDASLQNVKADVKRLNNELTQINLKLKEKEQSMSDITHASTHITALGIDFEKKSFLTLVVIVLLALLIILGLIAARLKLMQSSMKEKTDLFDGISKEYDDYKRKALEKQTKLSRELQDERNKMHR